MSEARRASRGTCALCHGHDLELRNSHLLPQWVYDRLQKPHRGNPNPVLLDGDTLVQTSRQLTSRLLCDECEQAVGRLDAHAATLAYVDQHGCALLGAIGTERVVTTDPEVHLADCGTLDRDKIARFAVSVVWRLHTARRFVELGPYQEKARLFVRGEAAFPRTFRLLLGVYHDATRPESPGWPMSTAALVPGTDRDGAVRRHQFMVCGLHFQLYVGQAFTPFHDENCLIHAPRPRVSVITLSAEALSRMGRDVVHARPVGRLSKDPLWRAVSSVR